MSGGERPAGLRVPEPHGLSALAEARRLPSGLKATAYELMARERMAEGPGGRRPRAARSVVARRGERVPSGLKATLHTPLRGP